jgi:hypothetical protein
MKTQTLALRVAGTVFGLVCLAHVLRLATHVQLVVAGWDVPLWLNAIGVLVTAALSAWLWRVSLAGRN